MSDSGEGVLSQNEINALLSAVNEGQIDTDAPSSSFGEDEPEEILHYDLTSQDRIIRGRMPTLDIINDRFCRLFRRSLSGSLRRMIHLTVESTNLMKFGEFLNYLPIPSCLNIVRLAPLRGSSVVAVEAKLMQAILDTFFGGAQVELPSKVEGRDFTTIELIVIRRIMDLLLDDLKQAWRPVIELGPEYVRTEINPQFVAIVGSSDVVVQTTFEVETEASRGTIHLVIPYSSVEPFKDRLSSGLQSDSLEADKDWMRRFADKLHEVEVDLVAFLGRTEITVGKLMELRPGDVIPLDTSPRQSLDATVQGKHRLQVTPAISGGAMAMRVDEVLEPTWLEKEQSNVG